MFNTKKIAILLLVAILFAFGLSVFGGIQANAIFDDGYLNVSGNGVVEAESDNTETTFATIMDKYKGVVTFVSGIATVTMVVIFILNFVKLGSTATNPTERQKVLTGLIWSGIAAALLGSVTLIVGVFYGMLK